MERSPQRPRLARTFAWLIYLTPLLVILQAFLFGSFYERFNSDLIDAHRDVGFISMILVVVLAMLAYFARFPRESRVLHLAIALALLWIIQWLLGSLTAEEARWVAILHVPNGLLVFGLALLLAGMTHRTLAASSRRSREGSAL